MQQLVRGKRTTRTNCCIYTLSVALHACIEMHGQQNIKKTVQFLIICTFGTHMKAKNYAGEGR
jgi:hypothetical protein